ncbi:hypothetical protein [Kitasatospora sp. NPDC087315]|uniref:hypothetical protein n=1 Tax=Kitasatospora sp. NPDC087315 TaxID=3364069 RepID=UPI0038171766
MTTMLEERSRLWQGEGGPQVWRAAWDRARDLLAPAWPDTFFRFDCDPERGPLADGAAGLATALYLIAAETGTAPADVHRDQVDELARPLPAETVPEIPLRWEARLRALGHDLGSVTDPVVVRWRILRTDNSPQQNGPDFLGDGPDADDSLHRWGPGVVEGLRYVLSPAVGLAF